MLSTKYFIIFSIIPFFIFAVPINDGARKALKTILKTMEKEITDGIRWRQTNCQDNSGFLDETEIAQKIQNLLKKMKNPKENLTKNDITNLFEAIEAFLDKIIEKMEVKLQTLEAYSPRMRFDEALKEEMKSPRKCFVNFGKSAEIESIHSYVDLNLMEKIRSKLTKLFILQTMAMPKKQQAYCQFFHMYYYKRQDLSKELSRIKDELDYGALAECATTTSWDETTQNYCCQEKWTLQHGHMGYECCPEKCIFCLPCWCSTMVFGSIVTVPKDLCRSVRMCVGKCKSAQIKAELAEIETKKSQIPQLDTSSDG